jgi:hypothetical protein
MMIPQKTPTMSFTCIRQSIQKQWFRDSYIPFWWFRLGNSRCVTVQSLYTIFLDQNPSFQLRLKFLSGVLVLTSYISLFQGSNVIAVA